jgi:hypothetical protein
MGNRAEPERTHIWRIGRYTFQHEFYPPDAPRRTWSCGVQYGPAGPVGAGGYRSPLAAFMGCRRFERQCTTAATRGALP